MKNERSLSLKKVEDIIEQNGLFMGNVQGVTVDYNEDSLEFEKMIGSKKYCVVSLAVIIPLEDERTTKTGDDK